MPRCAGVRNTFVGPPANRLDGLMNWIGHLEDLGANALLLGPVFESSAHGHDTADPGVQYIYYGSEWGIRGRNIKRTAAPRRPAIDPLTMSRDAPEPKLCGTIKKLIGLRHQHRALRLGD